MSKSKGQKLRKMFWHTVNSAEWGYHEWGIYTYDNGTFEFRVLRHYAGITGWYPGKVLTIDGEYSFSLSDIGIPKWRQRYAYLCIYVRMHKKLAQQERRRRLEIITMLEKAL